LALRLPMVLRRLALARVIFEQKEGGGAERYDNQGARDGVQGGHDAEEGKQHRMASPPHDLKS